MPKDTCGPAAFRKRSWIRRAFDSGIFGRSWRFRVAGAYIPRDAIREGEELRVRFLVRNESRHEGTIYYVVNIRDVYGEHELLYSSDLMDQRHGYTACVPARDQQCIEHSISWDELTRALRLQPHDEIHLAVEIELWTPGRVKAEGKHLHERRPRRPPLGMFQRVELMHNPSIVFRPATASCFLSYSWVGNRQYPENDHRSWIYRFADSLSRSGFRPVVDYNFLAPALINREVIQRALEECETIIIVYSDEYVHRMGEEQTGVGYEYSLVRSRADLWSKTIPIRRGLRDHAADLFKVETRFVADFENESTIANTTALVGRINSRFAKPR